jgi:hypothetical protein
MEHQFQLKRGAQCRKILLKPQNTKYLKEIEEVKKLAEKHRRDVMVEYKNEN